MPVIHYEGFDDIAVSDLPLLGYVVTGTPLAGAGRFTPTSFGVDVATIGVSITRPLSAGITNMATGAALKRTADTGALALQFRASSASSTAEFAVDASNLIQMRIDSVTVATGPLWVLNTWRYLEINIDAAGTTTFRIDGQAFGSFPAVSLAGDKVNVSWGFTGTFTVTRIDDWYIKNDATTLGDSVVFTRYPVSNDAPLQWTPSAGTNFQMVDDITPDGDATYNVAGSAGLEDWYNASDALPGLPAQIHAVSTRMFARKDDAAVRQVQARVRSGASVVNGATLTLNTSYLGIDSIHAVDPATGLPWTQTAAQNADIGLVSIV